MTAGRMTPVPPLVDDSASPTRLHRHCGLNTPRPLQRTFCDETGAVSEFSAAKLITTDPPPWLVHTLAAPAVAAALSAGPGTTGCPHRDLISPEGPVFGSPIEAAGLHFLLVRKVRAWAMKACVYSPPSPTGFTHISYPCPAWPTCEFHPA